ncbi:MAG: energy-coupling factor transporter transmembrane component T family protein [Turicibacter sp.]
MFEHALEKLSIEEVKLSLFRSAYGLNTNILSGIDGRIILLWYTFYAVVPWFVYNETLLFLWFIQFLVIALMCRVSKVILILMGISVVTQIGSTFFVSLFFGGNIETVVTLFMLNFKMLIIGLASVSVFASIGPEKLSDSLLKLGVPELLCFGISYGYRIIPMLIEEFVDIYYAFRIRGEVVKGKHFITLRKCITEVKRIMLSFYPMILNTAKRSRTTVEALQLKGFTYSMTNKKAKQLKTSYMKLTVFDLQFTLFSFLILLITIFVSM